MHFFTTHDDGKSSSREYHLVDGGVVANNNPTMHGRHIHHAHQGDPPQEPGFPQGKKKLPVEYKNYLIISLGIGSPKQAKQYTAPDCADWGMIK
jgi:hypothetical protein